MSLADIKKRGKGEQYNLIYTERAITLTNINM